MEADGSNEAECRVCRGGGEENRPLYTPCLCSGSIGLVHQDCLEAWLAHSKKDTCELCHSKYQFVPEYKADTPTIIPIFVVLKSVASILVFKILPYTTRLLLALIIWLVLVPLGTTVAYCTCMRRTIPFADHFTLESVATSIRYGCVIDAVMALSLLILMSFADFLRFHWVPAGNNIVNNPAPAGAQPDNQVDANGRVQQNPQQRAANHLQQQQRVGHNRLRNQAIRRRNMALNPPPQPLDMFHPDVPRENTPRPPINPEDASDEQVEVSDNSSGSDSEMEEERDIIGEQQHNHDAGIVDLQVPARVDLPPVEGMEGQPQAAAPAVLPPPRLPVQPRPPRRGANNEENDLFGAPDPNMNDDNQVHIAIMDVLGLEGPFFVMFRNAAWLLAFSSVYLTLLGFFPYVIGSILVRLARSKFDSVLPDFFEDWTLKALLNKVETLSATANPPLQFMDFVLIAAGYMTIIFVTFSFDRLLANAKSVKFLEALSVVADPLSQLAVMVKVGVLLIMRIFVLPITLGSAIICVISYEVLDYPLDQWAKFLTFNSVGIYGLAWVAGITFMLSMTISVLQLREVLHPDIFGKLVKPQEAHQDLIASLIQESSFVHAKRIVVSFAVYTVLLHMLIGMPLQIFRCFAYSYPADSYLRLLHWFPSTFFHPQLWYYVPELQVPFELLLGHICFLSVLDQKKDIIGRMQHLWLVFIANRLGLTRFIIPLPIIGRRRRRKETASNPRSSSTISARLSSSTVSSMESSDTVSALQSPSAVSSEATPSSSASNSLIVEDVDSGASTPSAPTDGDVPTGAGHRHRSRRRATAFDPYEPVAPEDVQVGYPLLRPPPGWDVRSPHNSTRWAWGTEEPSHLEKNVAPRVVPSYWLLRVLALCFCSWVLLVIVALFILIVPLSLGRMISVGIQAPVFLRHDPLNFVVGCILVQYGIKFYGYCNMQLLLRKISSLASMGNALVFKFIFVLGKRGLTYILIGFALHFLGSSWLGSVPSNNDEGSSLGPAMAYLSSALAVTVSLPGSFPVAFFWTAKYWVAGGLLLECSLWLLLTDRVGFALMRTVHENALSTWLMQCKQMIQTSNQELGPWDLRSFPSVNSLNDALTLGDVLVVQPTLRTVLCSVMSLVIAIVWQNHVWSLYLQYQLGITDRKELVLQQTVASTWAIRAFVGGWIVFMIGLWFAGPIHRACKVMYDKIRDEHYLVGRRLKNATREPSVPAAH